MPPLAGSRMVLSRWLARVTVPTIGAMSSLVALPAMAVPTVDVNVRTETVEVAPGAQPRLFTVECGPDEELLSGGYAGVDPAVRVVFSYPSDATGVAAADGARPAAWTVGVVSSSRTAVRLQVAANCLPAAGAARATVAAVTETRTDSAFSLAAACPTGPSRTGGGYSSVWAPLSGTAAVRASYPKAQGWGIDVATVAGDPGVRPTVTVSAYAVCLTTSDYALADLAPVNLDLLAGTPVCTGGTQIVAAACVTPRSGEVTVRCPDRQLLVGAGYLTDPALPNVSVLAAGPSAGPVWTVSVRGTIPTAPGRPPAAGPTPEPVGAPVRVVVTALCLVSVARPAAAASVYPQPPPRSNRAVFVGTLLVGLPLLLLLLLLTVLVLRRNRHRRRQLAAGVEVVVRGTRSGYRIGGEVR